MTVICHCEPTKVGVAISPFMSLRSGQSPLWQSRCCLSIRKNETLTRLRLTANNTLFRRASPSLRFTQGDKV